MIDDYFHGVLDRKHAEERLTVSNKRGSYLIRESDKKYGSFVLSFKGQSGINHFRITRGYGSYYIGGRNFDSLSELVEFYHDSDLLTDERLIHPIPPPEPVNMRCRLFVSVLPYTALGQDELSFKKQTLFILEYEHDHEWYWCRLVKTGEVGLVFANLLEEILDDIDPNEVFPWFHSNLTRSEAVDELAKIGPGSFLVKFSENTKGDYTLFYHAGDTVQRFKIVKTKDNRYVMGSRCFDSLGQVIEFYQVEQIYEGHCLKYPVVTSLSRNKQVGQETLTGSMHALQVTERPEDIYNTVKQSRELAQSREIRGWLSLKKGDLSKKWKKYYFILNPTTNHLYYYEKPQQSKPKGLIDLSYSYIYALHISLFDWPQCFQLIEKSLPCFASHFYLRCDDEFSIYQRWIRGLRKFTAASSGSRFAKNNRQIILNSSDFNESGETSDRCAQNDVNFTERRSITIDFHDAHLSKAIQSQVFIFFNQDVIMAKTKVLTVPTTIFEINEASFTFNNLPTEVKTITIGLYQVTKKSKPILLSEFNIKLDNLEPGTQIQKWFKLISVKGNDILGQLKLSLLYNRDIIMDYSQYVALEEVIKNHSSEVVKIMDKFANIGLADAFNKILSHNRVIISFLRPCIENEILNNDDSESLFEKNTFTNFILESYIRSSCQTILSECLKDPIKRLFNIGSLDIGSQNAWENLESLYIVLDDLIQNVYNSAQHFQLPIRYLFCLMQRTAQSKWPKSALLKTRVVARYLFIRVICPTVLRPRQYGLISYTQVTSPEQKKLALAAVKCLQNLANIVDSKSKQQSSSISQAIESTINNHTDQQSDSLKTTEQEVYDKTDSVMEFILSPQIEEWMDALEPVILKKKLGLIKFIDELCDVDLCNPKIIDQTAEYSIANSTSIDTDDDVDPMAKNLSYIHSCCESNLKGIDTGTDPISKNLHTTLNILTQRRAYYENLTS